MLVRHSPRLCLKLTIRVGFLGVKTLYYDYEPMKGLTACDTECGYCGDCDYKCL